MTYNHLKNVLKKIDANISEAGDDAEAISRCMGQGKYWTFSNFKDFTYKFLDVWPLFMQMKN